jgi:hypothetical protein
MRALPTQIAALLALSGGAPISAFDVALINRRMLEAIRFGMAARHLDQASEPRVEHVPSHFAVYLPEKAEPVDSGVVDRDAETAEAVDYRLHEMGGFSTMSTTAMPPARSVSPSPARSTFRSLAMTRARQGESMMACSPPIPCPAPVTIATPR